MILRSMMSFEFAFIVLAGCSAGDTESLVAAWGERPGLGPMESPSCAAVSATGWCAAVGTVYWVGGEFQLWVVEESEARDFSCSAAPSCPDGMEPVGEPFGGGACYSEVAHPSSAFTGTCTKTLNCCEPL